ncbi:MAG: hypothetical protein AAFR51_09145 [Pseudomonadota bacterium]
MALDVAALDFSETAPLKTKTLRWLQNERCMGSVNCTVTGSTIMLDYVLLDGRSVSAFIELTTTHPQFGGVRRWFVCPDCGRRCRLLHFASAFKCRKCVNAVYPSQYDYVRLAGEAKAKRAREQLGAAVGLDIAFATKPKGMHWKTYRKLEQLVWNADVAFEEYIQARL